MAQKIALFPTYRYKRPKKKLMTRRSPIFVDKNTFQTTFEVVDCLPIILNNISLLWTTSKSQNQTPNPRVLGVGLVDDDG